MAFQNISSVCMYMGEFTVGDGTIVIAGRKVATKLYTWPLTNTVDEPVAAIPVVVGLLRISSTMFLPSVLTNTLLKDAPADITVVIPRHSVAKPNTSSPIVLNAEVALEDQEVPAGLNPLS